MNPSSLQREYELVHNEWFQTRSKDALARKNQLVSLMIEHGIAPGQKKEKPKVKTNLLGKFAVNGKAVTNTETGEVKGQVAPVDNGQERLKAAIEEWDLPKVPEIKTRSDAEFWLRQRLLTLQEYVYVYQQSKEVLSGLESRLESWSFLFNARLEEWFKQNPPNTGKSLKTLFGSLQVRDQAARVTLDYENESELQIELANMSEELQEEFEVEKTTKYKANTGRLTKWYQDRVEEAMKNSKPVPVFRGLLYKPRVLNKFSVGPSLDTVKDKVRDGVKWEPSNV